MKLGFHLKVKPRYIVLMTVAMAAIMFSTAVFEIQQSNKHSLLALTEEAISLIETIDRSAETTMLSNIAMENLIQSHLINNGNYIAQLEKSQPLTREFLFNYARQNDVFHITVFDRSLRYVVGSSDRTAKRHTLDSTIISELQPLIDRTADVRALGLLTDPFGEGTHYIVAVRRQAAKGVVVLELDSGYLLDFRRRIGIGKLVQEIADNRGIVYIVLQDDRGILTASKNISTMNKIQSDSLIQQAIADDTALTRTTVFDSKDVFEVVKPFHVESAFYGVFRVGLSLDHVEALNQRTTQRFIVLSLVVIVLGVIVFGFISATQSYSVLSDEHRRIQTYTGTILDNMADAVVATDRHGRITVLNKSAEKLFNTTSKAILGKTCSSMIDDPQSCIERTLESGKPIDYEEATYTTKQGKTVLVGVGTSVIQNAKGDVDTIVAVIRDLSEQRRVEEQLHRQEKLTAMGELASSVAHEIRNPLNAISMTVQRFRKDFEPKEYAEEYYSLARTMQSEVSRVSNIINQFLQFSRPPKLNPSNVQVTEFLQNVVAGIESEARSRNIVLDLKIDCDGTAKFDKAQMQQVMLNLIQNAFHAMDDGGPLTVECSTNEKRLIFKISDTGKGISPEHLPKIFNLYFTTKPEGTGMGLSMAHQIVTEHGGQIDVESKVGRGTVFKITLPLD